MFRPGIWRLYVVIGLAGCTVCLFLPLPALFQRHGEVWAAESLRFSQQIWGGNGWADGERQSDKETTQVLQRSVVRRGAPETKDTARKAADWRKRCKCWACQTILKANLLCFKCRNTKSIAWGTWVSFSFLFWVIWALYYAKPTWQVLYDNVCLYSEIPRNEKSSKPVSNCMLDHTVWPIGCLWMLLNVVFSLFVFKR